MTDAGRAAEIHAEASAEEIWSADSIAGLAAAPGGFLLLGPGDDADGFALGRVAGPEAELLMLAVRPGRRRRGAGRALLAAFEAEAAARGATEAFLEVAEDNHPARALYAAAGYRPVGARKGYYRRAAGAADALLMTRPLKRASRFRNGAPENRDGKLNRRTTCKR